MLGKRSQLSWLPSWTCYPVGQKTEARGVGNRIWLNKFVSRGLFCSIFLYVSCHLDSKTKQLYPQFDPSRACRCCLEPCCCHAIDMSPTCRRKVGPSKGAGELSLGVELVTFVVSIAVSGPCRHRHRPKSAGLPS